MRFATRGKFAAAEKSLLEAARSLRRAGIASRPERVAVWNELGVVCKYLGKFHSARRYYRQALRWAAYITGQQRDQLIADVYHNLGGLEHSTGRFARAESYARKGLLLRLQFSAADNPAVASDIAALAAILDGRGRYDEARKLYRKALRTFRMHYGPVHPEIAVVLNNLGAQYQACGRARLADSYYRRALQMKRRVLGETHPDVALTMNNLATLLCTRGRLSGARQWVHKAFQLAIKSLGTSHPFTRKIQRNFNRVNAAVSH